MELVLLGLILLTSVAAAAWSFLAWKRSGIPNENPAQKAFEERVFGEFATTARLLREELALSRREGKDDASTLRQELSGANRAQTETLVQSSKDLRTEVTHSFKDLRDSLLGHMTQLESAQRGQLETFERTLKTQNELLSKGMESLRGTLDQKMKDLQADNSAKLDQMRKTVDEKLEATLQTRLTESFKMVSERLEQVHKGLGDMQSLASGVGDLKKVLTNVKTRGTWGEVQLGALLEQVLTPEQYMANYSPKKTSRETVEFAIRLPGQSSDDNTPVWLPIDSKFPMEDYSRLVQAQEAGDPAAALEAAKALEDSVWKCAKDIKDKYIVPPTTTDFAILFLPTESLYAEVLRRPGITEGLQRDLRVTVAGPTTLLSLLNSLQMGFRTLAIQKRSGEVWQVLGAVKTQFGQFNELLTKVQKKLQEANNVVAQASSKSRTIATKLKKVEELPAAQSSALLALPEDGSPEATAFDDQETLGLD